MRELAALAAMRAEPGQPDAADAVERESARPAFQVLVYPGRSANILPPPQAPPVFLLCGADDRPDIAEGLAHVYLRFKQAGVPAELHVYSGVGHGFGLRASQTGPVAHWLDRVREWMDARGLLKSARWLLSSLPACRLFAQADGHSCNAVTPTGARRRARKRLSASRQEG
jgi:endo-1,4-beta-xylanase